MSQHNENEPPPLGQISNTVTISPALPVNTQTEGSIHICKILQLLLSRMNTMEKTTAQKSTDKMGANHWIRHPTSNQKIVGLSSIIVTLNSILKVHPHTGIIIFLFMLVLILIYKEIKVFIEKLLIPQLRS